MKSALIVLLTSLAISYSRIGMGQDKLPQSVEEKEVPRKVLKNFQEKHPDVKEASWFPYPYRYWKESGAVPKQFPILWDNNLPQYYEARYTDGKGSVRKVYRRGGTWLLTSRLLTEGALPDEIISQLSDKGYSKWKRLSIELVTKESEKGKFYKIWLTDGKKKRILFFDQSYQLVKTLKWDNDANFTADNNAKFKNAPQSKRIVSDKLPMKVRTSAEADYQEVEIIEWSVYTRFYDPFQNGLFSYYDLRVPTFYQLLFSADKSRYKATYSSAGELLEVSQVLYTKDLPGPVRKKMKSKDFSSWQYENEHDKIDLEGGHYYYRIYGASGDEMKVLILDERGELVY